VNIEQMHSSPCGFYRTICYQSNGPSTTGCANRRLIFSRNLCHYHTVSSFIVMVYVHIPLLLSILEKEVLFGRLSGSVNKM